MAESYEDQLARVRAMATGAGTWDLSDNDLAALRAVLSGLAATERERDSHRQRVHELKEQLDAALAATAEWERAYQGALADEKRARRAALEEAARLLDNAAEEIKHTRHVDGLGMGWLDGEDLLKEKAAAIRALAGVTP
jgi:cell division septum initiation protein DivIVA